MKKIIWLCVSIVGVSASLIGPSLFGQSESDVFELSPFLVTGSGDEGYLVANSISSTRTKLALIDTTQNISVLNRQFLDDTGTDSLAEALKYTSGVSSDSNLGDEVVLRGFRIGANFTDGLKDLETQSQYGSDPFLFDRVEVLKGPSALVYGSHNNGGVVNRVRKRPSFVEGGMYGLSLGSDGYFKVEADWSQPLNEDIAVRVLTGLWDDGGEKEFDYLERTGIYPMLTWKVNDMSFFNATFEHRQESYYKDWGSYFLFRDENGNFPGELSLGETPRDLAWGSDDNSFVDNTKNLVHLSWETAVNESFSYRIHGQYIDWDHFTRDMLPTGILADNESMPLLLREITDEDERYSIAFDAIWDFSIGEVENEILFLVQQDENDNYDYRIDDLNRPVVNILDIDHNYIPQDFSVRSEGLSEGSNFAMAVQDQMKFFDDRLIAVVGMRFDDYDVSAFNALAGIPGQVGDGNNMSYKGGLVYKPESNVSLFFNYSETFQAIFSTNPDGSVFDPTEGLIYEAGMKSNLVKDFLSGTLSVFRLELQNILGPHPDPDLASAGFSVQELEQTNEGVELDLNLALTQDWTMLVSGSHISAETPSGQRIRGVPEETFSVWNRFDLTDDEQLGWEIGGGYYWRGERVGDSGNSFILPSYWTIDLFANYKVSETVSFRFNAKNVTDEEYAEKSINRNIVFAGAPRSVQFKTVISF